MALDYTAFLDTVADAARIGREEAEQPPAARAASPIADELDRVFERLRDRARRPADGRNGMAAG
jgi:hypothetical protein